jgi:hypothetical protein
MIILLWASVLRGIKQKQALNSNLKINTEEWPNSGPCYYKKLAQNFNQKKIRGERHMGGTWY